MFMFVSGPSFAFVLAVVLEVWLCRCFIFPRPEPVMTVRVCPGVESFARGCDGSLTESAFSRATSRPSVHFLEHIRGVLLITYVFMPMV